jgi:hypothetical protein
LKYTWFIIKILIISIHYITFNFDFYIYLSKYEDQSFWPKHFYSIFFTRSEFIIVILYISYRPFHYIIIYINKWKTASAFNTSKIFIFKEKSHLLKWDIHLINKIFQINKSISKTSQILFKIKVLLILSLQNNLIL